MDLKNNKYVNDVVIIIITNEDDKNVRIVCLGNGWQFDCWLRRLPPPLTLTETPSN